MIDVQVFEASDKRPAQLPAAIAIHDAAPKARGAAGAAAGHGETLGGSRNGRAPWPLPKGSLEVVWEHEFDPPWNVRALLAAAGSIYAAGQMRWVVMEASTGQSRAGGLRGLGEGVLDPENRLLLQPGGDGQLEGLFLEKGQPVFWSPLFLNANLTRPFEARVGDSLVLVGREQQLPSDALKDPLWTVVESLPVWPKPEIRQSRQLQPPTLAPLMFKNPDHLAASWSSGVLLAFAGNLFFINDSLQVTAHLTGEFKPIALSVDEGGVAHLIVERPDARKQATLDEDGNMVLPPRELWIVAPNGERTLKLALPKPFDQSAQPPLLTSNRDILVRGPGGFLALTAAGVIRWSRPVAAASGAIVTGDDQLITNDGGDLIAFDKEGQRTLLHSFGATLTCAAVLEEGGFLTVASANRVYRLRPNPRAR